MWDGRLSRVAQEAHENGANLKATACSSYPAPCRSVKGAYAACKTAVESSQRR